MSSISGIGIPAIFLLISFVLLTSAQNIENGRCQTPDSKPGLCIRLKNCTYLINLMEKNPRTPADESFLRSSRCGMSNKKPLVCCSTNTVSLLPEPGICGRQFQNKIYGGKVAKIDDFPWMAMLQYRNKFTGKKSFRCAGSLINDRYVLTAAHCVEYIDPFQLAAVRLGEWDTRKNRDCVIDIMNNTFCADPHMDVAIEKVISHEKSDIGLIRLAQKIEKYTDYIAPICLPLSDNLKRSSFDGRQMTISGWGKTERLERSYVKLKADVTVVPFADCLKSYRLTTFNLNLSSEICAGGEPGIDSCNGDSGGPLFAVDSDDNRPIPYYFIAGIVANGPHQCGMEGWPGIYTRVTYFIDWIQENLEP